MSVSETTKKNHLFRANSARPANRSIRGWWAAEWFSAAPNLLSVRFILPPPPPPSTSPSVVVLLVGYRSKFVFFLFQISLAAGKDLHCEPSSVFTYPYPFFFLLRPPMALVTLFWQAESVSSVGGHRLKGKTQVWTCRPFNS